MQKETKRKSREDVLLLVLFIGHSLYNRYVKKGAELEINISSSLRQRFVQMFTGHNSNDQDVNFDLNEVIQLFVDANKAMYKLLGYSFSRFKQKKDFQRLLEMHAAASKEREQLNKFSFSDTR